MIAPPGSGRGGARRIASSSSRSNGSRSSFVSPKAAATTGVVGAVIVVASAMAIVPVPLLVPSPSATATASAVPVRDAHLTVSQVQLIVVQANATTTE